MALLPPNESLSSAQRNITRMDQLLTIRVAVVSPPIPPIHTLAMLLVFPESTSRYDSLADPPDRVLKEVMA